jgi:hypothetical protein
MILLAVIAAKDIELLLEESCCMVLDAGCAYGG